VESDRFGSGIIGVPTVNSANLTKMVRTRDFNELRLVSTKAEKLVKHGAPAGRQLNGDRTSIRS
jgi:hypothetical protein